MSESPAVPPTRGSRWGAPTGLVTAESSPNAAAATLIRCVIELPPGAAGTSNEGENHEQLGHVCGGFAGASSDAQESMRRTLAAKGIAVPLARHTQDMLDDLEAYGPADANWLRATVPDSAGSAGGISSGAH